MLRTRIITGLLLAAFTILLVSYAPAIVFAVVIWLLSGVAAWELAQMCFPQQRTLHVLQLLCVLSMSALVLWCPGVHLVPSLMLWFFALCVWAMWSMPSFERFVSTIGAVLFAAAYLGLAWSHMALIHRFEHGPALVLMLVAATAFSDTGAFIAGKRWGKTKCTPLISPNKTVVGLWGGLVGAIAAIFVLRAIVWPTADAVATLGMGVLVAIIAPLGDLIESAIKRGAHVKDSGTIIPGHGGLLDRIDAYIIVAPWVYYYARWMF